jgi:hypothetical protein
MRGVGYMIKLRPNAFGGDDKCFIERGASKPGGQMVSRIHKHEAEKMSEAKITFHNKAEIKVQAQLYSGRTLVSTCVAGPGESRTLPAESAPYDIYLRNGATGWEIAHKLDSEAKTFTLSHHKGRYIIT